MTTIILAPYLAGKLTYDTGTGTRSSPAHQTSGCPRTRLALQDLSQGSAFDRCLTFSSSATFSIPRTCQYSTATALFADDCDIHTNLNRLPNIR